MEENDMKDAELTMVKKFVRSEKLVVDITYADS